MDGFVDLHLHSTCSDGKLSPEGVIAAAAAAGLRAVALADHDNIDGIEPALATGERLGIEVLSGVELSVVWGERKDVHLLGYAFDWRHPELVQSLAEFQAFRENRNAQIVDRVNARLAKEGRQPISFARVRQLAGGTVGRPHVALALLEAGAVRSVEDAFRRYLGSCNVPKRFFPADEAIDLLHRAGGVAVLAHPPFVTRDRQAFLAFLEELITLGLDGVEVHNSGASKEDIDWYLTQAVRRGLLVTGGSDYHGLEGEGLRIGIGPGHLRIPYACVAAIRDRARRYAGKEPGAAASESRPGL